MTEPAVAEIPPGIELMRRLDLALGTHDVPPEERERVVEAWYAAGELDATWAKLPEGVQALIEQIEQRPVQSWDDPMDVPFDDLDEMTDTPQL